MCWYFLHLTSQEKGVLSFSLIYPNRTDKSSSCFGMQVFCIVNDVSMDQGFNGFFSSSHFKNLLLIKLTIIFMDFQIIPFIDG
jgi:hypothetical protein